MGTRRSNIFAQAGGGFSVPLTRTLDIATDLVYSRSLLPINEKNKDNNGGSTDVFSNSLTVTLAPGFRI